MNTSLSQKLAEPFSVNLNLIFSLSLSFFVNTPPGSLELTFSSTENGIQHDIV